jgi:hypothetical protein
MIKNNEKSGRYTKAREAHVPFPLHLDLMVTTALCAASSRLILGLTFILRPVGSARTVIRFFIDVSS